MKRDINFIKHIKPQIKEKERVDKEVSRQTQYEKIRTIYNIEPPALDLVDVGVIASLLRKLRQWHLPAPTALGGEGMDKGERQW